VPPQGGPWVKSRGHVTHLTERDHRLLDDAPDGSATIGAPDEIAARVDELSRQGLHEVIYTPSGPDVARELQAFYSAAAR
jgi:5,10-methylenetetrahydromethanopterin reductase